MRRSLVIFALSMAVSIGSAFAQGVVLQAGGSGISVTALQNKAKAAGGSLPVLITFKEVGVALSESSADQSDAAYTKALRAAQNDLISDVLGSSKGRKLIEFDYSPVVGITLSPAEIAKFAADPRVVSIHENAAVPPALLQSLPIIEMTTPGGAYALNATGRGRAVAILDSGVNKANDFLRNKVISEACFNTTDATQGSTSRCPGGAASSTANNAGLDCNPDVIEGCGHGTHVAGIAAGSNTGFSAGEPRNGVAKSAGIVAINVFSRFSKESGNCGNGATEDCILSFSSDQIRALERVFALRGGVANRKIDSVNMSLGGGGFTGFCNDDPLVPIIKKLRRANIATVIASGNSSFVNGVGAPGCIEAAITVGASTKRASGQPERMASYTNQGPQVDVLAPGGDFDYPTIAEPQILSSFKSGFKGLVGTSMAAPHVAGAIAAIRSRPSCASKTVAQIENAFRTTGPVIQDHRVANPPAPQLKERRMDVKAVMKAIGCA